MQSRFGVKSTVETGALILPWNEVKMQLIREKCKRTKQISKLCNTSQPKISYNLFFFPCAQLGGLPFLLFSFQRISLRMRKTNRKFYFPEIKFNQINQLFDKLKTDLKRQWCMLPSSIDLFENTIDIRQFVGKDTTANVITNQ